MARIPQQASAIRLRGVRQNNLKNIDLDVPLGKLIVVTGLSGAGKSSLVFETLHAEGQRRYVETFSPYTRQFLEMMDRPKVDEVQNIRPSIAIQQSNTVKTSRSTVGTMTELCDFFKVWFCHAAELFDPETGEKVEDDSPRSIYEKALAEFHGQTVLLGFDIRRPKNFEWREIFESLTTQGFSRVMIGGEVRRIEALDPESLDKESLVVVQDRVKLDAADELRFLDGATTALHFGKGELKLFSLEGEPLAHYSEGLHSPKSGRRFHKSQPGLFSFNSPIGACGTCRGFGRVIEIDYRLVIPNESLTLKDGAIRPFQGNVYGESLRELLRACKKHGIREDVPYRELSDEEKRFVIEGEESYREGDYENRWYGVRRFFEWLESTTYKMHVRVFLSKYRAYVPCRDCDGSRLIPDALNWKWRGYTLPELYRLPVNELLPLVEEAKAPEESHQVELALEGILNRLRYLDQVGLGYMTLDRSSRTLSGGEVQRVNLTSCLGTGLVDTLFVLDEPSVGLHARDIDCLIGILRQLTAAGNTVVVVEHDEAIMRAADHLIEIGPKPGSEGGRVTFSGPYVDLAKAEGAITADYLMGRKTIPVPAKRKSVKKAKTLSFTGVSKHNIRDLKLDIPLGRFVCLSGVSGSGKSTLLNNAVYQGLLSHGGQVAEDPADIESISGEKVIAEVVLVDQSPISKTPRSNPALYTDAWDDIRDLFARTDEARRSAFTAAHFSFNSGNGRCDNCQGLGYERVEMQFMADLYVTCPVCEGKRFKPEVLQVQWCGRSVDEVLGMSVSDAAKFFGDSKGIAYRLGALEAVGLGYLPLGQPLNTLSGGESQRLRLVKYLSRYNLDEGGKALLLLDEPTTGLHRDDIARLLKVLRELVEHGHSLVVIEHHMDILKSADWIIEVGPEAGKGGGRIVFEGTPEQLAAADKVTSAFLRSELEPRIARFNEAEAALPMAAEELASYGGGRVQPMGPVDDSEVLEIIGAREHNLDNISLRIPHREMTVVTGVSGSGKSTLAFDIVFAEGQRRFMESMSAYARQFVEQLPRPDIDKLSGIAPTVAIEQRVTHGTRKSTVATITEVAQYLRLLYSRVGVQHSPVSGEPLVSTDKPAIVRRLHDLLERRKSNSRKLYICAQLIRSRKGHHQPLADWAAKAGYEMLRVDGEWVDLHKFKKLDRYREHDVDLVLAECPVGAKAFLLHNREEGLDADLAELVDEALRLGKGAFHVIEAGRGGKPSWFSTSRTDPATGESFPELDPKHFSWNSAKGWCPTCRGHGRIYSWMWEHEDFPPEAGDSAHGDVCPSCQGGRLNAVSQSVRLQLADGSSLNLPELLALTPPELLETMDQLSLDARGRAIVEEVLPEIEERLKFMGKVGLDYLPLSRATATLSGGEAQRIRLAAQLGSNLSGVLYVLDEPSIGLHARDNARLLDSLETLRGKGNTLLIVEHNAETMRRADRIIDLGPGAGIHGGRVLANGTPESILANAESLTGRYLRSGLRHPLRGQRRELPAPWKPRRRPKTPEWLVAREVGLRNLKGDDVRLPLGKLIAVCGISGAGKSTLVRDLLKPCVDYACKNKMDRLAGKEVVDANIIDDLKMSAPGRKPEPPLKQLVNGNRFRSVVEVDQKPIGKTPRSTPATYIGASDIIRQFFGELPEARMQGFGAGTFSFNTKGGRCEKCKGAGRVKLEMSFMPDTYVPCDGCGGRRFGAELDDIRWKGKNIGDLLAMTFEEAAEFFDFHAKLKGMLDLMVETGLGYLTLGQSSPTLSGGEAQRLKLVTELAKGLETVSERARGVKPKNLYILEEPTIGLHLSDCERLIELLHRLVDQGHTVILIEHHLDLIAEADYVVEMGPEGGDAGGQVLYQGAIQGLLKCENSRTAPFLREMLQSRPEAAESLEQATG